MEITRETIIMDIVENCPEAIPAFQAIGMHCISCYAASGETVEEACAVHGIDADMFLVMLEEYLESLKGLN